jgi:hypothetical protein
MADALSSFKAAAYTLKQQLKLNAQTSVRRPHRFVTRAATSHKVDNAISAPASGHAIRKFQNSKNGNLAAGQGLTKQTINKGANQKLRVAVDVDEGKI